MSQNKSKKKPSTDVYENKMLLNEVSKETRRIVEDLTKELIYGYRISNLNDSIIGEWRLINNRFEKRGESVVKINPQYYYSDYDLGLFDFTANVIQNVLSTRNLDLVINAWNSKKPSEITLENGKIISSEWYRLGGIGFKMHQHIIEKYMNEKHKWDEELGWDEEEEYIYTPTTLEYEQKCGFNDDSGAVYIGLYRKQYSIYGYITFIMGYLFNSPLIDNWCYVFEKEYILKQLCDQK